MLVLKACATKPGPSLFFSWRLWISLLTQHLAGLYDVDFFLCLSTPILLFCLFELCFCCCGSWGSCEPQRKDGKEEQGNGGRDLRGKILPPVLSPKASSFLQAKNSHGKRKTFIFPTLRKDKCLQNDFNLASSLELVLKRIWWKINSLFECRVHMTFF